MEADLLCNNYTVYCHETPSGKRYVGITRVGFIKRWNNGNGYRNNIHFWRAIQKYGWSNIEHNILFENVTKEFAELKEKELIKLWNCNHPEHGYNAEGGGSIRKEVSEFTKAKLSNAMIEYYKTHQAPMTGKSLSEETKKKISEAHKGMKWSEEQRLKALKTREERPYRHSEESKMKIRLSNKSFYQKMSKAVCQYDSNGILIATFCSIREACKMTNTNRQQLSSCCNGASLTANGYYWCFLPDNKTPADNIEVPMRDLYNKDPNQKIAQFDLNNNLICVYNNIYEIRERGYVVSYVRRCCNHKRKTYRDSIWKYVGDEINDKIFEGTNS